MDIGCLSITMLPYFVYDTINIGPFTLYVWGLFAALAFAAALLIALKETGRKKISENHILNLAVLVLFGAILGSRLAFVFENWDYFGQNFWQIFKFDTGGLMFYGGFIGALALSVIYIRLKKLNFWKISDTVAPSLAIGEFIGRIGCSLADLHIGSITALPWGQKYIDESVRHPIGIYMSINGLALFIFLRILRKKIETEGALFLIFILWYSGTRFLLDFLRCADLEICDPRYFGLTPSQYISIPLFFSAIAILIFKHKQKFMQEQQPEQREAGLNNKTAQKANNQPIFKKYWACAIIFLTGLIIGLGISSAFYERLFKQPIFPFRAKTWVAYGEPVVGLTVVTDKNCVRCDISDVIKQLKTVIPTLVVKETDFKSDAGKGLLSEFKVKSLPALVFAPEVEKAEVFEKISPALQKENNKYYVIPLNSGIVPGKFLELPEIGGGDRVKGPDSAPITIIEFSDFQCPYCKAAEETIGKVLAAYPDKVKLVYKHLPLAIHPDTQYAAEAAECAGDQGKFWEMRDKLFANQSKLDKNSIAQYGRELKIYNKKFIDCLYTGQFKAKIDADAKTAADFNVIGTPAFFVGDEFISGIALFDDFKAVIENQLKK